MPPPLPPGATYVEPDIDGQRVSPPLPKGASYVDQPEAQPDPGFWSTLGKHVGHGAANLLYGGAQLGAPMREEGDPYTTPEQSEALQQRVTQATRERAKQIEKEPGTKEHPVAATLGDITGEIAASSPLFVLPGGLPTMAARALGMAVPGTLFGAMQPATSKNVGREKLGEAITSGVGAMVTQPVGELVGKGLALGGRALYRAGRRAVLGEGEVAAQEAAKTATRTARAEKLIAKKFKEGGAVATEVMREMQEARAAGQPYSLLDAGPEQVEQLAGTLYRSQTGKQAQALKDFQKGRISQLDPTTGGTAQYTRLRNGIRGILGSGSVTEATERLAEQRSANARPLWDAALEGGSTAPLEQQFTNAFEEADRAERAATQKVAQANAKLTQMRGRQTTLPGSRDPRQVTGEYSIKGEPHTAYEPEVAQAQRELTDAQVALRNAKIEKEQIGTVRRQAQEDGDANMKGAVWNPHIQRILDAPASKEALARGLNVLKNQAAADNVPFNPHEWAIVGIDAEGGPIAGKVPNMKMLQMLKEGYDDMLEGEPVVGGWSGQQGRLREQYTRRLTKAGRAVAGLRRALLENADAMNPDWKIAREQWAGDTAGLEALNDGKVAFTRKGEWSLEDFQTRWGEMNPAEREMFKLGIADSLSQDLEFATDAGFENKAVIKTPRARNMLYTMFRDSPGDADRFIDFIERERRMYRVGGRVMSGSPTAGREAADIQNLPDLQKKAEATRHGLEALWHFKTGHPIRALHAGIRARNALGWTGQDPVFNEELMRILTNLDPQLSQGEAGTLAIGQPSPAPQAGATRQYLGAYGTGLPTRWIAPTVEDIFGQ